MAAPSAYRPMYQCLYRPPYKRICLRLDASHGRPFSSTVPRTKMQSRPGGGEATQKSMRTRQREKLAEGANTEGTGITDMGLMPGTVVRPSSDKLPSLFDRSSLTDRWRFEKAWFWSKILSLVGLYYYKFRTTKPRPKTQRFRGQLNPIATELYETLYTSLAAGDVEKIKEVCCDGIATKLETRIAARRPGETVLWRVDKYHGRPRVVSDKCGEIPDPYTFKVDTKNPSMMRQVILKIKSTQTLLSTSSRASQKSNSPKASSVWTPGTTLTHHPKHVLRTLPTASELTPEAISIESSAPTKTQSRTTTMTEYLVLQKRMIRRKEGDWQVWGLTTETTLDKITEDEMAMKKQQEEQASKAGINVMDYVPKEMRGAEARS